MKILEKNLRRKQNSISVGMVLAITHTGFWGFVICFVLLALIAIEVPFDEFMTVFGGSIIFASLGVIWIRGLRWKQRCLRDCTKYYRVLKEYSHISITEFAGILNQNPKQVRQNVTYLIGNRCIEGIHYTYRDDAVTVTSEVHPEPKPETKPQPVPQPKTEAPKPPKNRTMVAVTCKSCCGITMLPMNSVGVCDYCGSKIKS